MYVDLKQVYNLGITLCASHPNIQQIRCIGGGKVGQLEKSMPDGAGTADLQ